MTRTWKLLAMTLLLFVAPGLTGEPVNGQGPTECEVLCVTSNCQSHEDCTAAPHGRCDFVCPGNGCCVYR